MKKSSLLKTTYSLLLVASILSCKKNGSNEINDEDVKGNGKPTITFKNTIPAPIALTVNGKTDTLNQNATKSFEGNANTSLKATAKSLEYKYYSNSIGGATYETPPVLLVVGEIVTLDLTATFPGNGTKVKEIKIPDDKYLVMIQNNTTNRAVSYITVNYGLPSAKVYQFATVTKLRENKYRIHPDQVINNGVITPIGFFNVITPTSFYLFGSSQYWIYQNIQAEGGSYYNLRIGD